MLAIILPHANSSLRELGESMAGIKDAVQHFKDSTVLISIEDAPSEFTHKDILDRLPDGVTSVWLSSQEYRSGANHARNTGLEEALRLGAQWAALLDIGDRWIPSHLQESITTLSGAGHSPAITFGKIHAPHVRYDEEAASVGGDQQRANLLRENYISTQTLVWNEGAIKSLRFLNSLPRLQDWNLALDALQSNINLIYCPRAGAVLDMNPESISRGSGSSHRYITGLAVVLRRHRTLFKVDGHAYLRHAVALLSACVRSKQFEPTVPMIVGDALMQNARVRLRRHPSPPLAGQQVARWEK